MQDEINGFIRRSMKQAECGYEDIFADDACGCGMTMSQTDEDNSCGCAGTMGDAVTKDACGCGVQCRSVCDQAVPVMVFIEAQPFGRMYNEAEGLCRGTLFPALDKPFTGRGGCR